MTEKIKPFWDKIKEALRKVPKKLLFGALAVLVILALALTIFLNTRPYTVLFTGLNNEEASSIMSYLSDQGITDYRLENTDTIMVPQSQENALKAKLLMAGYPKSGFSYSTYYDHVSALSTESERNRAYLNSLQERMGAVIRCFDGVKDASVTITPGENRSYVLDSENVVNASAAVLVTMQSGQKLTNQQSNAIRSLVAHSVQGLNIDSVVISDTLGNSYTPTDDTAASGEASQLKMQLEEQYNNKIRTDIMQVLAPIFGEDNVRVGVNCTVDVNRTISNATDVFLPEWANDGSTGGKGIIGSLVYDHRVTRNPDDTAGGVVGAEPNADLPTYVEEEIRPNGTEQEISAGGQVEYDNPRKDTHIERTAGYISDCMVSVTINSTTAGAVDLDAVRSHVARVSGIGEENAVNKISIMSAPFYTQPVLPVGPGQPIPLYVILIIAGVALFLLVLVIVLLILLHKRRKKKALQDQVGSDMEELLANMGLPAEPLGADVMTMHTERSMELRQDIRKFADENPEIAAQMIKIWLKGGEEDG